jgi:hypothetical protein
MILDGYLFELGLQEIKLDFFISALIIKLAGRIERVQLLFDC